MLEWLVDVMYGFIFVSGVSCIVHTIAGTVHQWRKQSGPGYLSPRERGGWR